MRYLAERNRNWLSSKKFSFNSGWIPVLTGQAGWEIMWNKLHIISQRLFLWVTLKNDEWLLTYFLNIYFCAFSSTSGRALLAGLSYIVGPLFPEQSELFKIWLSEIMGNWLHKAQTIFFSGHRDRKLEANQYQATWNVILQTMHCSTVKKQHEGMTICYRFRHANNWVLVHFTGELGVNKCFILIVSCTS